MNKPNQYIGVTGVMRAVHAQNLLNCIPVGPGRKVMIGVLASSKTVQGIPNRWPHRYPSPEDLGKIFVNDPRALNLVHFNTKEEVLPAVLGDMFFAAELAGPHCHGLQLNMAWPDPLLLSHWRGGRRDSRLPHKLVLQIGAAALATVAGSGRTLADHIEPYVGIVDYVLLDPSGGEGRPFDVAQMLEYLRIIHAAPFADSLGVGVAGGLSVNTLDLLDAVAAEFPDVSCDAEGRLRDENDDLDMGKADPFVRGANRVLIARAPKE